MPTLDAPAQIQITLCSRPYAVRQALEHLTSELRNIGMQDDTIGSVEIVMGEVLNNVVEHAYPIDEDNGAIDIICRLADEGLSVVITDYGNPMPDDQLPPGDAQDLDAEAENLPEGGFGWFIIKSLATDISYIRGDGKNMLSLLVPASAS